jgi:hypothetical protein
MLDDSLGMLRDYSLAPELKGKAKLFMYSTEPVGPGIRRTCAGYAVLFLFPVV